jgi:PadR family transcriptional regulator PadR
MVTEKESPEFEPDNSIDPYMRKFIREMNAGTVSLVLLAVLEQADRPLYGYEIARMLGSLSTELARVKQGTLYPVLRSMERSGLLSSHVEPSVSGPPRRYYTVTETGREGMKRWRAAWVEIRDFVDAVLEGENLEHLD